MLHSPAVTKGSKSTFFGACTSICQLYVVGLARDADNRVIDSAGRCYNCCSLLYMRIPPAVSSRSYKTVDFVEKQFC